MKPRTEAVAFRIWSYCEAFGWEQTLEQIAEGVGETSSVIRAVMSARGWITRIKRVSRGKHESPDGAGARNYRGLPPHRLREYGLDPSVRE